MLRNNDGHDAASDEAGGFTTKSLDIDIPTLIGAGYCSDEADCKVFYSSYGCTGHHQLGKRPSSGTTRGKHNEKREARSERTASEDRR